MPGFSDSACRESCTELAVLHRIKFSRPNGTNIDFLADFSAILFPSSAVTTAAARTKQFGIKLIKYFA